MEYADGQDWRNNIKKELSPLNITIFDPYHKPFVNEIKEDTKARKILKKQMDSGQFDKVAKRMRAVRADDLRLCDISDFIIAYINPKIPSWGTAEELFWTNRLKHPLFLIVEGGKKACPLWIMGTIPHKYIYSSIDEVIDCVKKIDNGLHPLDNYRWRLLRKEFR